MAESAIQRLIALEPFPQPPLIRLRYPLVLMHGFGLFAALRRNGHLHDHALYLRERGVMAYAPNVPPYNPVPDRASIWKQRIEHVLEETGAEKVNLIAHSMGGLDARYLITPLEFGDRIASLTTIASPHHGSSIAAFLLEQPDTLRDWLSELANWMGTQVMREVEADFLKTVTELTPEHVCKEFNPSVPDHPGVKYGSYSACAGKNTNTGISPFLRPLNYILYNREGENDGFVSVESARWGDHHGTIKADHGQQLGLNMVTRNPFDSYGFFKELTLSLADEGF